MPGVRPQRGFMGPDVKVERETVYFLFDASFPKRSVPAIAVLVGLLTRHWLTLFLLVRSFKE